MANVNEIASILEMVTANMGGVQKDTLAEFAEKAPTKDELTKANKEQTNFKWMAVDGMLSVGNFVLNQYRQRQFENLQKNAEMDADAQLKEREERLNQLKKNLGITALEEHIQKQDKALEEISKMLSHLVAENKKEKKEKQVKDLLPTKF